MAKHKFASISLTVRDRAISAKFSTQGVSKKCTLCNFPKIFPSPHMAAILNFRIFAKNGKTQILQFSKNPQNGGHFEFSTHRVSKKCFAKNRKTGICFYLLNKRLIGWTLHMIMCVLLCYPVSIHMSQLQATGRPISSYILWLIPACLGAKTKGLSYSHNWGKRDTKNSGTRPFETLPCSSLNL